MNKDQKLLEECYNKVLQEETNLEKTLKSIETDSKDWAAERKRKEEEKLKDLSKPVTDELGHDEKGNFIYLPSQYEHGLFYKSHIYNLFDKDYKKMDDKAPIQEGALWLEQDINTKKVYRATKLHGRLMRAEVPREEVKQKGLDHLITYQELQRKADKVFNGDPDVARGWYIAYNSPIEFFVKFYDKDTILKSLEALKKYTPSHEKVYDEVIEKYKKAFRERETNAKLSKDFDVKALEDF